MGDIIKVLKVNDIKNLSLDTLIEAYRNGYVIEELSPHTDSLVACSSISPCSVTLSVITVIQGNRIALTVNWSGGTSPFNVDLYVDSQYYDGTKDITGTSVSFNTFADLSVGSHIIFAHIWYNCSDGSQSWCNTPLYTITIEPSACTEPSVSIVMQ